MRYTVKPRHKHDRNSHFTRRVRQPASQLPIGLQQEDELHSSSTSTAPGTSGSGHPRDLGALLAVSGPLAG